MAVRAVVQGWRAGGLRRLSLALCAAMASAAAAQSDPQAPAAAQAPAGAGAPPIANSGFEQANPLGTPLGWTLAGADAGYRALLDRTDPHQGSASARLSKAADAPASADRPFGTLMSSTDAAPYRGKRIRFSAAVRVGGARIGPAGQAGQAGLWLREDRGRASGFFAGMQDRPVTDTEWRVHSVEGDVAPDATRISFGLILAGVGEAWIDSASIEILGNARSAPRQAVTVPVRPRDAPGPHDAAPRALGAQGLTNLQAFARTYGYVRFFHPSDQAAAADWNRIAIDGLERAERARNPRELAEALNATFRPVAPTFRADLTAAALPYRAPPAPHPGAQALHWQRAGYSDGPSDFYPQQRVAAATFTDSDIHSAALPGGVTVHVPLKAWTDSGRRTLPAAAPAPSPALPAASVSAASERPADYVPSGFDRSTRLAAVIAAWNALQHFYPYWNVVEARWPQALDEALRGAATDPDDLAFEQRLRRLMAHARDGHGSVVYAQQERRILPLDWVLVEGKLVVTAAAPGIGIVPGETVTHIGGRPAEAVLADAMALRSGSERWRRHLALAEILTAPGGEAEIGLLDAAGAARTLRLPYRPRMGANVVRERRPEAVAEVEPGILYVDLGRMTEEAIAAATPRLAAARGIVFDLRGYPPAFIPWLPNLTDRPIVSVSFGTPTWRRPDGAGVTFEGRPWQIEPRAPRFTANTVFVTDESALSYSESILGTVKGNRLARIVGAPTGGANGNIARMALPGNYQIVWTGMRVLNLDGSRHHVVGVTPDIPVARTIAGVRAGRDELLDRALQEVRAGAPSR